MFLRCNFPRSIKALQLRAHKYRTMIKEVLESPVRHLHTEKDDKAYTEEQPDTAVRRIDGIKIHEKVRSARALKTSQSTHSIANSVLSQVLKNLSVVGYQDIENDIVKAFRTKNRRSSQRRGSRDSGGRGSKDGPELVKAANAAASDAATQSPSGVRKRESIGKGPSIQGSKTAANLAATMHEAKLFRTWIWDEALEQLVETEETEEDLLDRWLVNPSSSMKLKWDLFIGLLIVISVVIVPLRLGFDIDATPAWKTFDYATDVMFAIDIIVNFRTCYNDDQQVLHTSSSLIARQYFKGWLGIDFASTFPFDVVIESIVGEASKNLRGLRLIRIIRLVRLVKLVKILTASSMDAADDVITLDAGITKGLKMLATLCFIGHLFGCFFSYITLDQVVLYGAELNETAHGMMGYYPNEPEYNPDAPRNGVSSWWVFMGEDENDLAGRYAPPPSPPPIPPLTLPSLAGTSRPCTGPSPP